MKGTDKYCIIVAGGSGKRMNAVVPKQFLELDGKPVLMHTLEIFHSWDPDIQIILALHKSYFLFWEKLQKKHHWKIPHKIICGGTTRFHSVKNALTLVPDQGIVFIHDAVRPLVSIQTIERCYHAARKFGNAVPATEVSASVRMIIKNSNVPLDRTVCRIVQTPQVFSVPLIKKAFNVRYKKSFTDDATVFENSNNKIHLVAGNPENIKITSQSDLMIAEALIRSN